MSAQLRVWLDGSLVPASGARVPAFDRGFLFGDGIYETMLVRNGRPFLLGAHLARLGTSARRMGICLGASFGKRMAAASSAVVSANGFGNARLRIVVSRGAGQPHLAKFATRRPTVLVYAVPYEPPRFRGGIRTILARTVRNDARAADPAIKTTSMLNLILARREADRAGAYEAVMLNPVGLVAEAISANVFFVKRGILFTPALSVGILAGITRTQVIGLARRAGMRVRTGAFRARDLLAADEVFLTSSTAGVVPVGRIGRRRFRAPGPVTRTLREGYARQVALGTRGRAPK